MLMTEILHNRSTKVVEIGNSLGFRIKKFYLELAGMAEKDTEVIEAVIKSRHGIFIGHWLPGEQPDTIDDSNLEKLQRLIEDGEE